ncbi:MAG: hypothetical protein V1678_02410 [Candidatus Aenigmatarchaeota archaeon]
MKWLTVVLILAIVLVAGCTVINPEIDTGQKDCIKSTSGAVGAVSSYFIDSDCKNRCQQQGYTYKQWKCSSTDTIVCVCNR